MFPAFFLDCMTVDDELDILYRNVGNKLSKLRCLNSQESEGLGFRIFRCNRPFL